MARLIVALNGPNLPFGLLIQKLPGHRVSAETVPWPTTAETRVSLIFSKKPVKEGRSTFIHCKHKT